MIFIQVATVALCLGISTFQLTLVSSQFYLLVDDLRFKIPAFSTEFCYVLLYVVTVVFQMFQYCWFGNEVLVKVDTYYERISVTPDFYLQSGEISTSAFEMNFADAPLHVRKNLAFFITRTQKPIKIPVLNLTFLSLQSFIKVKDKSN